MAARPYIFGHPATAAGSTKPSSGAVPSAAAGSSPRPYVPACTLRQWWDTRPLGWQLVRTRREGASPTEPAGARAVSAVSALSFGQMLFPPL